jgi:hypothetical protein
LLNDSHSKPNKWAGRVGQVVQRLPNRSEALSSNPNTTKKNLKKKKSKIQVTNQIIEED